MGVMRIMGVMCAEPIILITPMIPIAPILLKEATRGVQEPWSKKRAFALIYLTWL